MESDDVSMMLAHGHVFDANGQGGDCLETLWEYSAKDPYALHMNAIIDAETIVPWVMSRETMTNALVTGKCGIGDVQIWASEDAYPNTVRIRVSSPEGTAWIHFLQDDIEEFLSGLPIGVTEEPEIEWDDFLREVTED